MAKISSDGRVEMMCSVVAVFIMAFVVLYMFYSNNFFMRRRMKELGIYALLGYRKVDMLCLLTIENIFICLGGMFIGIFAGSLLHIGVTAGIVALLGLTIDIGAIPFINPHAVSSIFLFILAVLLTLTISNAVLLLKSTLLDLVRLEKKVEKPVRPNIIFSSIGIISLLGGYVLALDMVRGVQSVWTTIGFYPIALLTLVLVVVGTVLSIYSFAPFVCQCIKNRHSVLYHENTIIVVPKFKPDILLMDINLGKLAEEDGLLLAQSLLQKYPNQKIVVLSGYDLPVYRKEAEKLGAKGFINKDIEPEELLHILERINNGSTYFEKDETYIEELTETEKQVLRMLASSMKRKEIAEHLFMSERTVSNHLQHIFEKLEVSSAVEAVTKAIQLGYIPPL